MLDNPITGANDTDSKQSVPVPNDRPPVTAQAIASFLSDESSAPVHNFDGDKMAVWHLTAHACGPAIRSDEMAEGTVISIRYFYLHYIEMVDRKTGEVVRQPRTALIAPDMQVYGFVSVGVAQSVMQTVDSLGPGPYDPPIEVTVKTLTTRSGYRTKMLVPV